MAGRGGDPARAEAGEPDPGEPSRRELILYATPTGPLAAQCDRWFADVGRRSPTVAQDFPPHCTLTGFFRRTPERTDEVVAETIAVLGEVGPVPPGAVEVVALRATSDFVGLELRSRWLLDATERVAATHRLTPGDDALRPKSDLHLSLAYGVEDLARHRAWAETSFDHRAPAGWELGLWERGADGSWTRLTSSRPTGSGERDPHEV